MKRTLRNDQSGMVAIIITMIMMFVITLIVLGFAENTRRNQRESLDTQLAMQAYYAAETGVNDVTTEIKNDTTGTLSTINHANCQTFAYGSKNLPRNLTTDRSVANTCLMIDSTPASLVADGISASGQSVVWDVNNAAGLAFSSLKFSWQSDVGGNPTCSSQFKTYSTSNNWNCDHALLRVDILRADTPARDAAALAVNTATLYLQPTGAGSATQQDVTIPTFDSNSNNKVTAYQGACIATNCAVTVNFNAAARTSRYYVRLTTLYSDAKDISLTGVDSSGGAARFKDGQVVVDSTGRAQDQLKRIRVRIPLTASGNTDPTNAVQSSGSTCKDILIPGTQYQTGACQSIWPL